ncbi:insulinoma-associated protein 1a [Drosophila santomea]|uniref:insulinoma-associated protein 1a n=1 Tax=Drosophila santomea TaxID=129105 RepID=UPI0019547632|nr:insulinoma-associated protein 1a [Drosophila santomea]
MAQMQIQTPIPIPSMPATSEPTEKLSHPHSIGIQLQHKGMPHGLGLLTTVASLPPKYRSRYLNLKTRCEIPLDLTLKLPSPLPSSDVPMAATFAEVYSEDTGASSSEAQLAVSKVEELPPPVKPPTPPQSPAGKRKLSRESNDDEQPAKVAKKEEEPVETVEATPAKPVRVADTAAKTNKASTSSAKPSRNKATRKLKFDEETSSPVSGTIIRPLEDITDGSMQYSNGDIDPKYNIVEITEETKAELAAIKNVIGDYVCRLCKIKFEDAFGLARHRCACIVLLEYRCPECGKQFNCPANLASHRRWHKPRKEASKKENRNTTNQPEKQQQAEKKSEEELAFDCQECGKKFKRAAYLRKHQLTHQKKEKPVVEKQLKMKPTASTTTITGSFHFNQAVSTSSSSASSSHSDEGVYVVGSNAKENYDYDNDYLSDSSSSASSAGYGRLQIVEHGLTEEESIAAAALTNLRNCASVIQHTTMAH